MNRSYWYTVVWWGSIPQWLDHKYTYIKDGWSTHRATRSLDTAERWLRDIERNASGFAHNARIHRYDSLKEAQNASISD